MDMIHEDSLCEADNKNDWVNLWLVHLYSFLVPYVYTSYDITISRTGKSQKGKSDYEPRKAQQYSRACPIEIKWACYSCFFPLSCVTTFVQNVHIDKD